MNHLFIILAMMILGALPATTNAQCQSKNTFGLEKVESTPVVFRAADINLRARPGV